MNKPSVKIEKVVYGAKGLGTHHEKKVFIPKTFTGDEVTFEVLKDTPSYQEARATSFLAKSPYRRQSPCQYFSRCGGCQWLDIKDKNQTEAKSGFIRESLERIGKIKIQRPVPVSSSPDLLHYRNRILLRGTFEEGRIHVGFFEESSHKQIPINQCKIAHDAHNNLIDYLNSLSLEKIRKQKFRLEVQVLPEAHKKSEPTLLIILIPIEKKHALHELYKALKDYKDSLEVIYQNEKPSSNFHLFENHQGISYFTRPGVFQQINTKANHIVREQVQKLVSETSPKSILDLYCGSGNLSLSLGGEGRKIHGIETNATSIEIAKHNVSFNQLNGHTYEAKSVMKFLKGLSQSTNAPYDFVIIDPPRRGAKEEISLIKNLNPRYILYISCDPTTLARDIKALSNSYQLKSLEGFDFFPQTYHIETLALLELTN